MNWAVAWWEARRILGWDNPNSFGYLFHSGSGETLILGAWGTCLWGWRTSCHEKRLCLRHARHDVPDPETGVVHKVCWKHAGLPSKYGTRVREIQAKHRLLYLGERPGRG